MKATLIAIGISFALNVQAQEFDASTIIITAADTMMVDQMIAAQAQEFATINYAALDPAIVDQVLQTAKDGQLMQALKANVIPIVAIPAEYGSSVHDFEKEIVEAYVIRYLAPIPGRAGFDWFRPGPHFGGPYVTFLDSRTMTQVKIFLFDTFNVVFSDGSTLELKMMGLTAASGLMFQIQMESGREADGTPVAAITPPSLPRDDLHVDPSGIVAFERTWISLYTWGTQPRHRNQR